MLYDVLELLMNYMQYLYLMVMIAPSVFPTLYSSPLWLLDIVMSATFSSGGTLNNNHNHNHNDSNVSSHWEDSLHGNTGTSQSNPLSVELPSWIPLDLRLLFALTNIIAPLVLVFLSTLFLGPPLFTVFLYILCGSVFFMLGGILLLLLFLEESQGLGESWRNALSIQALMHRVTRRDAVIVTSITACAVVLLLAVAGVLLVVLRARNRARVVEQLRHIECAPGRQEERVARRLLRLDSAVVGNEAEIHGEREGEKENGAEQEEEEEEARVQQAKAEMAYQRLSWRRHKETQSFYLLWTVIKLTASVLCCAAALLFASTQKMDLFITIHSASICYPLVAVLLLCAFVFGVSFALGLTQKGRQRLFNVKLWLHNVLLSVILLIISFLYAPILRNAINLFPCNTVTVMTTICMGSHGGGSSSNNSSSSAGGTINGLDDSSCMKRGETGNGGVKISSLAADPTVPCGGVDRHLMGSAILASASYAVFFLLLYGLLARQALHALQQYPLGDSVRSSSSLLFAGKESRVRNGRGVERNGNSTPISSAPPMPPLFASHMTSTALPTAAAVSSSSPSSSHGNKKIREQRKKDAMYYERVSSSKNEAQFLYSPYAYKFRYFKLVVLLQKTATVVVSTLTRKDGGVTRPSIGFAACVFIHGSFFIVLIVCRPYARPLEFAVSLALQVILTIIAAMGLVSALVSTAVPLQVWSFVTSCLFLVPCIAVGVGAIMTIWKNAKVKLRGKYKMRSKKNKILGPCSDGSTKCHLYDNICKWFGGRCFCAGEGERRWYAQCGSPWVEGEIFIPALYFVRENVSSPSSSCHENLSSFSQNIAETRIKNSAAVVRATPVHEPLNSHPIGDGMPGMHTNNRCQFLLNNTHNHGRDNNYYEGEKDEEGKSQTRAGRHWAVLRAAVRAGRFHLAGHQHAYASTATSTKRIKIKMKSSATPLKRITSGEQSSHSVAMTTLLASVGNLRRWEMSPHSSSKKDKKKSGDAPGEREGSAAVYTPPAYVSSPPQEARRREAFLQRVHTLTARQQLLALHHQQKRHLVLQQRAVDCFIGEQMAKTMRTLLLLLGITTTVALALCVWGMLRVEGVTTTM